MSCSGKKAFTLIELLVVISIIAMLLAILMPALSRVKKMAAAAVCLSNEKQLVLGWLLYAEDFGGKFVDGDTSDNTGAILHNDSSTFAFADGHADRHKWTQERTRDMAEKGVKNWDVINTSTHPGSTAEDYYWFKKSYIPGR